MLKLEMVEIMEIIKKIVRLHFCGLVCLLCGFNNSLGAQENFADILKASYRNGKLRVTFVNLSYEPVLAPDLSLRTDSEGLYFYDKYWMLQGDTMVLNVTREVSQDLYTLTNREGGTTSGRLFYNDYLLSSRKKRTFKVKIKMIPDCVKFLSMNNSVVPLCRGKGSG